MSARLLPLLLVSTVWLLAGAGCLNLGSTAAPPTRFYVLSLPEGSSPAEVSDRFDGVTVGLAPPVLPQYLDSRRMAVRTGANSIDYSEFHRWGEELDDGIARVLAQALQERTAARVLTAPYAAPASVDYEIVLRLQRFEAREDGSVYLQASWDIADRRAQLVLSGEESVRIADGWDGQDYGQLAAALSRAIVRLAEALTVEGLRAAAEAGQEGA